MNAELKTILTKAEGRFFEDQEAEGLIGYADAMLERIELMKQVEDHEERILHDVAHAVMERFPEIPETYGADAEQRVCRDQMMVLRYATLAAVFQSPDLIHDKLAVWLRTILFSLVRPEMPLFGFDQMVDACRRHLGGEYAEVMVRYIDVIRNEFRENMDMKEKAA